MLLMANISTSVIEQELSKDLNLLEKLLSAVIAFLPTLIAAVAVLIVGAIASKIVLKIMARGNKRDVIDKTTHKFLMSLVQVVCTLLTIVIALSVLGIPMASIIAVIASAGVAIGLALKDSLSNVAGGFIILFTKPFKVGDYVECGGVSGTVDCINIIYTRLLTSDNKAVYIPNGQVSNSTLINYNDEGLRRLDLEFSISYENDFVKAERLIASVIEGCEAALSEPAPLIRVCRHDSSAIVIAAKVWVKADDYWDLNFDLYEKVKKSFDENGISIPYNKLDIHIDK